MKVALVYPPTSLEERYGKAISKVAGNLPPVGLLTLAAVLRDKGYEVIVLDGSVKTAEFILSRLKEFNPEIIGLSCMTFLWPKAKEFAGILKQRFPGSRFILGGVHASLYRKKCLEEAPEIEMLVFGEGEVTAAELLERIRHKKSLEGLKGVIYREGEKIKENPARELITDLDELPFPARDLIDIHEYTPAFSQYKVKPVTNIYTTRGCPQKCLFCTPDILGNRVRFRSPENVVKEIELLHRDYGIRDIDIWDDNFTIKKSRVLEFCKKLIEKKMNIFWSAQARVDAVDEEMAELMAESGCWKLHFGIESMVQKNLDTLRKGTKVEQIYKAIKAVKKYGIEAEASFIFGIPGETYEDGLVTVKRMKTLDIDYARCFFLTPVGGDLEKDVEKYGTVLTWDRSKYQYHKPVFVPYSLTEEELEKLVLLAYKGFYFNPRYIFKRIKKMMSIKHLVVNINGFIALTGMVSKLLKDKYKKIHD